MSLYQFPFPWLSISPFLHFPFSFLFSLSCQCFLSVSSFSFPRQPLSQTLHFPTLAHTPTCRVSHRFSFHSWILSFSLPHPKGCPVFAVLTSSLLLSPDPTDSLHICGAGWETLFLLFCKVFHGLKSHRREPNQLKIPSTHSFKSDLSNSTRMWFSRLAEHTWIHYILVEPGNLL